MDIQGRTVLMLGGSGLVGQSVGRALLEHRPAKIVISALTKAEAEDGVASLLADPGRGGCEVEAEWGDMFMPGALKDRPRAELLADPDARRQMLDALYGDLTDDAIHGSALGAMIDRHQPDIIIDAVNTATAFAYQNVFASASQMLERCENGAPDRETVEQHLLVLYLPQLIRHVQIALEAMKRAGTAFYLKIGTAGTGGMGLNIPFTHSEERPSRMLLAKSSIAGAQTLLLYLMARTPGAPAVKEIKPTAAISWKHIGFGPVRKGGRTLMRYDADPVSLEDAFGESGEASYREVDGPLEGVYLDAGENGLFSLGEFETLTALGLMEYITPEEIAGDVVREIRGAPTGREVIAALDASTAGPTYRAGVLREVAVERMRTLEAQHGVQAVAYEMLGPPRLSKLLFEGAMLARLFGDIQAASSLDPDDVAARTASMVAEDDDLRIRILSIGLPILLPDGRVLRGPSPKVAPEQGQALDDPRLADNGWVDLRPSSWTRWRERLAAMARELDTRPGPDQGSQTDVEVGAPGSEIRPGRLAAWIFRHEDDGERIKR
jgi:NAD(P)-dependent dehydrogenase (short-subunit alcohol dehydrogenase family)